MENDREHLRSRRADSAPLDSPLVPTFDVDASDLPEVWWVCEAVSRGLPEIRRRRWRTSVTRLDPHPGGFTIARRDERSHGLILAGHAGRGVFHLRLEHGWANAQVAAPSAKEAARTLGFFRRLLPEPDAAEIGNRLLVTFWYARSFGPDSQQRRIEVPGWEEISANYSRPTHDALETLMDGFRPDGSGRLLLWHGPPGTGKTYALRALGWEWREWCDLHYVTDPEAMFGSDPGYLLEVATDLEHQDDDDRRWRLIVLEDTGELLGVDAKAQVGQALSRMLNLLDGILGQGLRVMVLITTNEPIETMHPALTRPGRCAAHVHFAPLSEAEALRWLAERRPVDPAESLHGPATLAELHSILDGRHAPGEPRRPVGFSP